MTSEMNIGNQSFLSGMEEPMKVDRISDLPWDILEIILVRLPLRDAARTGVLSSKWTCKWTCCSEFVCDDKCLSNSLSDKAARWGQIVKIMHQIQSKHTDPIKKFKLSAYCQPNYSDLDQWMLFLTDKGIEELIIQEFDFIKLYKLPCCLFSCPQLSRLELFGCIFKLPQTFEGFNCLTSLQLTGVFIDCDTLESLILNCPVLERLALVNIHPLTFIKIHSPSLKYLKIHCGFGDICLENCPLLATVICRLTRHRRISDYYHMQWEDCNFVRVLGYLHSVKTLTLYGSFIQVHGSRTAQIVRPDIFTEWSIATSNFNQLRLVSLRGTTGTKIELEFIQFILERTPVLEKMTIVITDYAETFPRSMLQQAERASENARIVFLTS